MVTDTMYNKSVWYAWEELVVAHYQQEWFCIIQQNYTIPGGEIDIIATQWDEIVFVEVKVVQSVDDLFSYVTAAKKKALRRSIDTYMFRSLSTKTPRLDVVFVKDNDIYELFEWVEL